MLKDQKKLMIGWNPEPLTNMKRFKEPDSTCEQINKEQDTSAQPQSEGYKFSSHNPNQKQMSMVP